MNYRKTNKHTIERLDYEDGDVMFDLHSDRIDGSSTSTLHVDLPSLFIQLLENEGLVDFKDAASIPHLHEDDIKNLGGIIMNAVTGYMETARGIRRNHYR
jgi:hypothetical protein